MLKINAIDAKLKFLLFKNSNPNPPDPSPSKIHTFEVRRIRFSEAEDNNRK